MPDTFFIHGLAGIGGYLLGAVPFGIVIAKLFGLGDLRSIGWATSEPPMFYAPATNLQHF